MYFAQLRVLDHELYELTNFTNLRVDNQYQNQCLCTTLLDSVT